MEEGERDKEVASSKKRVQKSIPYLWSKTGWKTIHFGAAHTYVAHIREYQETQELIFSWLRIQFVINYLLFWSHRSIKIWNGLSIWSWKQPYKIKSYPFKECMEKRKTKRVHDLIFRNKMFQSHETCRGRVTVFHIYMKNKEIALFKRQIGNCCRRDYLESSESS